MLHASTCLPYSHFGSELAVDSLRIRDRLLYTDAALLPFGKQLKTQLSVMGMSLRIWTRSAISLTLKPRVEITLIAASRDSLNPPQLSLWVFPSLTTIGQTAGVLKITEFSASTSVGPQKRICISDCSEIHFNDLFVYVSIAELDHAQVSDMQCSASKALAKRGKLRERVTL